MGITLVKCCQLPHCQDMRRSGEIGDHIGGLQFGNDFRLVVFSHVPVFVSQGRASSTVMARTHPRTTSDGKRYMLFFKDGDVHGERLLGQQLIVLQLLREAPQGGVLGLEDLESCGPVQLLTLLKDLPNVIIVG